MRLALKSAFGKLAGKTAVALLLALSASGFATFAHADTKTAIFAGGCFWCVESDFEQVGGVISAESGYSGGTTINPTYKNHTKDKHLEAVRIFYDPAKVNYETLLKVFWRSVDPTDAGGQFCDRGNSYTTAVFAVDDDQKKMAQASKQAINDAGLLKKPIITPIRDAAEFYPAETYHQDYYKKNPLRYGFYRRSCGRNKAVKALWGNEAYFGIEKH